MRTFECVVVAGLVICLTVGPARPDDKKEPGKADKLMGTWVVTKVPAGIGTIQKGTTLEFQKDGKLVIKLKPGAEGVEATYEVDGNKVIIQDSAGKMTLPIETLTGEKLVLGGKDGIECAKPAK
jgi:uncharacterized protein (TIGR03066 family)